MNRAAIANCILKMATERGEAKSICPSEVARNLFGESWRSQMPLIRDIAAELVVATQIVVTQKGHSVHPVDATGPIRISITKS
ncbi:DUF3253 domain-containing protein [Rubripirellula amarantea]|nr:DUF3253 domain-containing protein [Rubripirellula amarantea]